MCVSGALQIFDYGNVLGGVDNNVNANSRKSAKKEPGGFYPARRNQVMYKLFLQRGQQCDRDKTDHHTGRVGQINGHSSNQHSEYVAGHFAAGQDKT